MTASGNSANRGRKPAGPGTRSGTGATRAHRVGNAVSGVAITIVWLLFALVAVGRVVRAPPAVVAAAVTFLPYLYAGSTALVFLGWAVFPRRRMLAACVVALVVFAALLWGPKWEVEPTGIGGEPVRVMSWNLRRLWGGPEDGGDAMRCAVDAIEIVDPDVLTLLEVSHDDVDQLETALGLDCVHHSYTETGGPRTGGLAACVRGADWRLRSGKAQRYVDRLDWYYVLAEFERSLPGGPVFNLLSVHLSPYEYVAKKIHTSVKALRAGDPEALVEVSREGEGVVKGQADQSAALLERVDKFRDPTIVAGDFNSTRDSSLHATLRRKLKDAWEVGGAGFGGTVYLFDRLPLRIDYVYVSDQFRVRHTEIPEFGCSDHQPVVSDVVLGATPP